MKRFWLVMLSLGLVLAFSASAMAVDVKFSGSYYAAGMYQDRTSFMKNVPSGGAAEGPSTAFYYQRLRVGTDFIVSPGLKLVTRFDAMERAWGAPRAAQNTISTSLTDPQSSATTSENENIAFDIAYVSYTSPIGLFNLGYQPNGAWGTIFGDDDNTAAKLVYAVPVGPVTFLAQMQKGNEYSVTAKSGMAFTSGADRDLDKYTILANYAGKGVDAGLLLFYARVAIPRSTGVSAASPVANVGLKQILYVVNPYAKAKVGPVKLQAEFTYATGTAAKYESVANVADRDDIKLTSMSGWIDATADFGMVYAGASVAYISGDDPGTTDKGEGGVLSGGNAWNPCLLLFNNERAYWAGNVRGYNGTVNNNNNLNYLGQTDSMGMTNAWFFQGRVGVKPIAPLDIMASVSFANADKKPNGRGYFELDGATGYMTGGVYADNNAYGWEFDVTGTYKITNNLSYMLGAAYLFTGDYFRGLATNAALAPQDITNNYLLINKLTLTF